MLEDIQRIILVVWILHQQILIQFWEHIMIFTSSYLKVNLIAAYVFFTAPWIVSLPFRIYDSFFCEDNNLTTFTKLMRRSIKKIVSAHTYYIVMAGLLIIILTVSINTGLDYYCFFIFCMLVTLAQVSMDTLYTSIFSGWLYKDTPLEDGLLKTQLQELFSQCGIECLSIYVRHSSLKSCTSVAQINGSYHKKLIMNNLLLKYDNNLTLAIIAHEIGHLKLKHSGSIRDSRFIVDFVLLIFLLYTYRCPQLYAAVGFYWMRPEIVAAFVLYHFVKVPLFGFINYFYLYRIVRKQEIEADNFVIDLKKGDDLRDALFKLWQSKPIYPIMNTLYKNWFSSSIPLIERLNNINLKMRKCS